MAQSANPVRTTKVIFNYLTNKFGILLFVMTILPFTHQLFAQSEVASVFLNPYYSQRILAWEDNSGNQVSTWQIDISYGTESNGVITYEPVLQFFQSKTYLKLANEYVSSPNYFYQITGLDANGNPVGTPTSARTCTGCDVSNVGNPQKCNGRDYAYQIQQFHNGNALPQYNFLEMQETVAFIDISTQTATHFYWFMSENAYMNQGGKTRWPSKSYDIIEFNTSVLPSGMKIKNPLGADLNPGYSNTNVVGIGKRMEGTPALGLDYDNYKNIQIGQLAPVTISLPFYEIAVNTTVGNPVTWSHTGTFENLQCIDDNNQAFTDYINSGGSTDGGSGGPSGGSGFPYIGISAHQFYEVLSESINGGTTGDGPVIPKFSDLNAALEQSSDVNTLNTDRLGASDIIQFEITDLATGVRTAIYPTDIEDANGQLSLANYSFTGGLYKANIMYQNNLQTIPFYFEGDNTQSASNGLSNFLNVTIYPVPVTNGNFTINMIASKDLFYTYQMLDMNGNIYTEKDFEIGNGEEINFFNEFDSSIPFLNNIIVNKFTFEDGSTLIVQSIIAPN